MSRIDIKGCFEGGWKDIVMPNEGYKEIAWWLGKYVHEVETKKRGYFDSLRIRFDGTVIHGDLEDLCTEV